MHLSLLECTSLFSNAPLSSRTHLSLVERTSLFLNAPLSFRTHLSLLERTSLFSNAPLSSRVHIQPHAYCHPPYQVNQIHCLFHNSSSPTPAASVPPPALSSLPSTAPLALLSYPHLLCSAVLWPQSPLLPFLPPLPSPLPAISPPCRLPFSPPCLPATAHQCSSTASHGNLKASVPQDLGNLQQLTRLSVRLGGGGVVAGGRGPLTPHLAPHTPSVAMISVLPPASATAPHSLASPATRFFGQPSPLPCTILR
ncbi:unnamed protein product [Closterium sp. Naga37s-1]|nr:unnamed protein product [Closterium sp. Naga37s-1]